MSSTSASPQQVYREQCEALKVKINSSISRVLPISTDAAVGFTEWDLSGNVVGTRGAIAVLKTVELALPNLAVLNLSGNNLSSPITKDMLAALLRHPSLHTLDVSGNDIRLGGPELVELVKRNKNIINLKIEKTFLRPLFERLISIHLNRNRTAAGASRKSVGFSDDADEGQPTVEIAEDASGGFGAFGEFSGTAHHVAFADAADGGRRVPRRATVCAGVIDEADLEKFTPEVFEKDPKVREWLKQTLERHHLFSHLEDYDVLTAVDAMSEVTREAGSVLFEQDDEECDLFYIIGSGEVEISRDGDVQQTLKHGDTTQDLMLMYPQTCPETGRCAQDTTLYCLDRQTYRCIVAKASKKKRAQYEGFLQSVGFLKGLKKAELLQLADALKSATFEAGATLIKYGEIGETFFLIIDGTVEVFGRNDAGESIKVCEFTKGENVGELEFINNHKCVADVKAKGFVRAAKMNRHHFEMVMGPVKELLARTAAESTVYEYYRHQLQKMDKEPGSPAH